MTMPPPPAPRGSVTDRLFAWVGRHKIASALIGIAALLLVVSVISNPSQPNAVSTSSPPTTAPGTSASTPPVELVKVPRVRDRDIKEAKAALKDAGFQVTVVQKYSHEAPGTVLNVSEDEGSQVEAGTPISITVARRYPTVPNVVGLVQQSAMSQLRDAGYKVVVVKQESSRSPGTVISITPSAGSEQLPGKTVKIVVAKKPAAPPPPPPSNCTPGYSPCLPEGPSDYDCAGGSGNGPAYTKPGVTYRVTGSDPYGLDSDGDGYGCE
jgi:hypothetical protein